MKIIVRTTADFSESLEKYNNIRHAVENTKEYTESHNSLSRFEGHASKFPDPYLVRKKIGSREFRLVARKDYYSDEITNEEYLIVTLLKIFIRGSKGDDGYDSNHGFGKTPKEYAEKYFEKYIPTREEFKACIPHRKPEGRERVDPNSIYQEYLSVNMYEGNANLLQQTKIYESLEWINKIKVGHSIELFAEEICNILTDKNLPEGKHEIPISNNQILMLYKLPKENTFFLADIILKVV